MVRRWGHVTLFTKWGGFIIEFDSICMIILLFNSVYFCGPKNMCDAYNSTVLLDFFASLPIAFFIFPFHLQSLCFLTYFFRGQQIYLAAKLNLLLSPFVVKVLYSFSHICVQDLSIFSSSNISFLLLSALP